MCCGVLARRVSQQRTATHVDARLQLHSTQMSVLRSFAAVPDRLALEKHAKKVGGVADTVGNIM